VVSCNGAILPSSHFVVDGDNLIGSWGGPRPGDDLRAEVVRRVAAVCARLGATACVVFDRAPGRGAPEIDGVTVQVAARGQSADEIIRAMVDAAPSPDDVTVVTSDKPLYSYARTRGARILRAREWRALENPRH
jgi:predicted RNA-binding protein with PIN domain